MNHIGDNGREFRNSVINSLKTIWPGIKIIHGRSRRPQSQGSVERANGDVKIYFVAGCVKTNLGPLDPNNIICLITEEKNSIFKLVCQVGVLDKYYAFNSFLRLI